MEQYDIAVIGAGPGGYPAAIRAAQLGLKTALIEKEAIGGTCLNCGCIPTKTLIARAQMLRQIQHAETFGIHTGDISFDYGTMVRQKNEVIATLQKGVQQLLKANGVHLLSGQARYTDAQTITVDGKALHAEKSIIATGSRSIMPGFLPDSPLVVDSRAFLERDTLPEHLLVLGGGYIGCEMACLAAAFGVQVTLVEMLDDILLLLDRDVRAEIKRSMKRDLGITILTGQPLQNICEKANGTVSGTAGEQTLEADLLLAAAGRAPVSDTLDLEKAGLSAGGKGQINVNEYGCTAVPGIYAVGDVNGKIQLAHAATAQGICAAEHAAGNTPEPPGLVPGVIFTIPEAAIIGTATGTLAKDQVKTAKFFYRALGKALASGETAGFAKWIADPETNILIGAQAVGAHATDLIAEAALAIQHGMAAQDVGSTIHGHPTFGEIWMEAAHALEGHPTHAAPPRK